MRYYHALFENDTLARRLILAHYTAMIDRNTLERWLNDGAHALRSMFSLAQQYRYSGATREDFAAGNAVARNAIEKSGQLPQEIMDGTRRSRFAPPLMRRTTSGRAEVDKVEADEAEVDEGDVEDSTASADDDAPDEPDEASA